MNISVLCVCVCVCVYFFGYSLTLSLFLLLSCCCYLILLHSLSYHAFRHFRTNIKKIFYCHFELHTKAIQIVATRKKEKRRHYSFLFDINETVKLLLQILFTARLALNHLWNWLSFLKEKECERKLYQSKEKKIMKFLSKCYKNCSFLIPCKNRTHPQHMIEKCDFVVTIKLSANANLCQ